MSDDLLTDLDLAPERETVREPAKRWRNKWKLTGPSINLADGTISFDVGAVIWGSAIFPTREIAEQRAREAMQMDLDEGKEPNVWLGAFPVDENGEPP